LLACGCLVGLYETYDGPTVAIVDARGAECHAPGHTLHAELMDVSVGESSASDPDSPAPPDRPQQ
jgi:hypothetical protein